MSRKTTKNPYNRFIEQAFEPEEPQEREEPWSPTLAPFAVAGSLAGTALAAMSVLRALSAGPVGIISQDSEISTVIDLTKQVNVQAWLQRMEASLEGGVSPMEGAYYMLVNPEGEEVRISIEDYENYTRGIGPQEDLGLLPYSQVSDLGTPQDYYSILVEQLNDPAQAAKMTIYRNLSDYHIFPVTGPRHPFELIESGRGDCDDFASLACEAIQFQSEEQGYDYQAIVVDTLYNGMNFGHAVCTFVDQSGQRYVIDQSPAQKVESPFDVKAFQEFSGPNMEKIGASDFFNDGTLVRFSIGTDFLPNYQTATIFLPERDMLNSDFDASPYLGENWRDYTQINVYAGWDRNLNNFRVFPDCSYNGLMPLGGTFQC